MTESYRRGHHAFIGGEPLESNPHGRRSPEDRSNRFYWFLGFFHARISTFFDDEKEIYAREGD